MTEAGVFWIILGGKLMVGFFQQRCFSGGLFPAGPTFLLKEGDQLISGLNDFLSFAFP